MSITVQQLRVYATVILGWKGRGLTVYPDDTFLVSYPRSGNTWMRFLISNLIFTDEPSSFLNIERRVPEIYLNADWILRRLPRPRYFKSHECFEPRYKRVIYVVRDPRDAAVSHYHFSVKQRWVPDGYPMATFVERWMEASFEPQYGAWREHVQSWLSMRRGGAAFLLVRYEDLQARPNEELARIAKFLGLPRSNEQISRAIELSSADRMRALEKKQQRRWVETRRTRLDKPFVRKATVGDWRTALPRESVELIESAWSPLMEELGYPIGTQALEDPAYKPAAEYSAEKV